MVSTLEVRVETGPGGATVHLAGDVDSAARAALDGAYAEATGGALPEALLLDFTDVGYISSSGIALIVGLLARARADRVAIAACALTDHYREIFEITRLSDFMSIYRDEAEAVAAARGGER